MSDGSDHVDQLVRETSRVRDEDLASLVESPAATALFEEIISKPYPRGSGRQDRILGPRRVARGLGIAAALVAAALLLSIAVPLLRRDGDGTSSARAAEFLRQQAEVAASRPALHAGSREYYYVRGEGLGLGSYVDGRGVQDRVCSMLIPRTFEFWFRGDGSGRDLEKVTGEPTYPSEADRRACRDMDILGSEFGEGSDHAFPPGFLDIPELASLPTDPEGLRRRLERRPLAGLFEEYDPPFPPGDSQVFSVTGELLAMPHATPELRSALFEVAASLPTTEYVGPTEDATGRPGIAIAHTSSQGDLQTRLQFVVDPETSELLERTETVLRPTERWPAGTLLGRAVFLEQGVVSSTQERP